MYSDTASKFLHLCCKAHAQLPERKHHVQNQRNQALFFFFSRCSQKNYLSAPIVSAKAKPQILIHFNLVFWVYSLKKTFFTRLHSLLARAFPFGAPLGCLFKSVSTMLFPALPLHLLKLPLVHLVAGRHPKYAEV